MKLPKFSSMLLIALLIVSAALFIMVVVHRDHAERFFAADKKDPAEPPSQDLAKNSWRFVVSGDSRNCGDVVVPAIAAHSAKSYQPSFYWHLGDLRAIYMVDEDMAFAGSETSGRKMLCQDYLKQAWPDFVKHQIYPFGKTSYYLGIGNHEVIPPKGYPPGSPQARQPEANEAQFTSYFSDWLLAPAIREQRLKDQDCDNPPSTKMPGKGKKAIAKATCVVLPRNYYHWIQGGVDFIYLDNASNIFGPGQLDWFLKRVAAAKDNTTVQSLVIGMHEALPDSISSNHAMCDDNKKQDQMYPYDQSCREGRQAYTALLDLQNTSGKQVYVLASHSHFYMDGIFKKKPVSERLRGWIVGTAGAIRYALPGESDLSNHAETDVYGYLVGTVDGKGNIRFDFQRITEAEVPPEARQRYQPEFVNWCFAHNSENREPTAPIRTNKCLP